MGRFSFLPPRPTFIRHVLEAFRQHTLTSTQAATELGLSRSRLYALATAYNTARAKKQVARWTPGTSGGNHAQPWPAPVLALLQKRLACSPPCPYNFVASEARRLHDFPLDRAQVRRWAIENKLAHAAPPQKIRTPVRVGDDGRVPIGTQRLRIERPPGTKVILCLPPTGHHSVLAYPPDPQQKPALLFTNHPI